MDRIEATKYGSTYRPEVFVSLIVGDRRFHARALLDSGADHIYLGLNHLDVLGIDREQKLPIEGLSVDADEPAEGDLRAMSLDILFGPIHWHGVVFIRNRHEHYVLLGRDFFEELSVRFEWSEDPPAMYIEFPNTNQ